LSHQTATVDALARLLPDVCMADGTPESPRPEFPDYRSSFLGSLIEALS
jgi:hypothetical protein